jgi:hypothetical protein
MNKQPYSTPELTTYQSVVDVLEMVSNYIKGQKLTLEEATKIQYKLTQLGTVVLQAITYE